MVRSDPRTQATVRTVGFQPSQGPDKVNFQEGRRGRWRNPSRRPAEVSDRARVSPDEAHEIACAKVKQPQNAIHALDEKDPFVASMRTELQKARSKGRLVPVEDRIKSTTAFFERARKRELAARKELEVAQEDICWSASGRRLPRM